MELPTADEILHDVRQNRPRGYKRFTEQHARRIEWVISRRAVAVGSPGPLQPADLDEMTSRVVETPPGSILGTIVAFAFSALGQYLIQACCRWAIERAWARYLASRKA